MRRLRRTQSFKNIIIIELIVVCETYDDRPLAKLLSSKNTSFYRLPLRAIEKLKKLKKTKKILHL